MDAGSAQLVIKPVIDEEALEGLLQRIASEIADAVARGLSKPREIVRTIQVDPVVE